MLWKSKDLSDENMKPPGVLFDVCGTFSLRNGGFGKNVIIFDADIISSVSVDNKEKILMSNARVRQYYINC